MDLANFRHQRSTMAITALLGSIRQTRPAKLSRGTACDAENAPPLEESAG